MKTENYIINTITNSNKIYIDTSTLMDVEDIKKFLDSYRDVFLKNNKKILIFNEVIGELHQHRLFSNNKNKKNKAIQALQFLESEKNIEDSMIFEFESNVSGFLSPESRKTYFADKRIHSFVNENRPNYTQLIITKDKKLAKDLLSLNSIESIRGKKIIVKQLSNEGILINLVKKETPIESSDKLSNSNNIQAISDAEYLRKKILDNPGANIGGEMFNSTNHLHHKENTISLNKATNNKNKEPENSLEKDFISDKTSNSIPEDSRKNNKKVFKIVGGLTTTLTAIITGVLIAKKKSNDEPTETSPNQEDDLSIKEIIGILIALFLNSRG